jgi:hypothetical protein
MAKAGRAASFSAEKAPRRPETRAFEPLLPAPAEKTDQRIAVFAAAVAGRFQH